LPVEAERLTKVGTEESGSDLARCIVWSSQSDGVTGRGYEVLSIVENREQRAEG
jgi:hypothetical protein